MIPRRLFCWLASEVTNYKPGSSHEHISLGHVGLCWAGVGPMLGHLDPFGGYVGCMLDRCWVISGLSRAYVGGLLGSCCFDVGPTKGPKFRPPFLV